MKITDNVFGYIWNGMFENNCNSYYFGEPFNILFDPGLKNHVEPLLNKMKADGIDTSAIKYIVNTHCHPDHFEGTLQFFDKDISICMDKDEIDFFNQQGPMFFSMFQMEFPKVEFKYELNEGPWEIEGKSLEIIHTPGHSPGSMCIYWKEKKTLVCGDLIFDQSFGRVDFPGGDPAALVNSIERISKLDIEHILPGHMNHISGKNNVEENFKLVKGFLKQL
jgi:hydroxyacylglutathione hydrolase